MKTLRSVKKTGKLHKQRQQTTRLGKRLIH